MTRWCDNGHPPMRVESGRRCAACSLRREAGRPSRQARGYGADHTRARAALASMLPAPCGYANADPLCPRTPIMPGSRWDAAHAVDGRPEHGWFSAHPDCNQRARGGVPPRSGARCKGPAQRLHAVRTGLDR